MLFKNTRLKNINNNWSIIWDERYFITEDTIKILILWIKLKSNKDYKTNKIRINKINKRLHNVVINIRFSAIEINNRLSWKK